MTSECLMQPDQTYRDFSGVIEPREAETPHMQCDQNFPMKLQFVLGELEKDGMQHIASWAPHGRCFKVHNTEQFVKDVLPLWFRQSQISSFQRQLNLYSFTRVTSGPDKNSYFHEKFLRGKMFLARHIQRQSVKGKGPRRSGSIQSQPNFYTMPYLPPFGTLTAVDQNGANSLPTETNESSTVAFMHGDGRASYTVPHPPVASNRTLQDLIDSHRSPNQGFSSLNMAHPSRVSALRTVEAGILSTQAPHQHGSAYVAGRDPLQVLAASVMSSSSARVMDHSHGNSLLAAVEAVAASRQASWMQDHARAQMIAHFAQRLEQEALEEENERRLLILALLSNGAL